MSGGQPQETATGGGKLRGDDGTRECVAGQKPAEGQFLDWVGVMQVDPRRGFGIGCLSGPGQRNVQHLPALSEDALREHQRWNRQVRVEPGVCRQLLAASEVDIDKNLLVIEPSLREGQPCDHREVR